MSPNFPKRSLKRFLIFKSWQIWKGCLDLGQCMPSLLKAWTCPPEPKHFYASIINKKGCLWWWRPFKTIKCKWATEVASSRFTRRYFRKFIMSGFLTLLKVTSEWLSAFGGLIIMVKEVGLLQAKQKSFSRGLFFSLRTLWLKAVFQETMEKTERILD